MSSFVYYFWRIKALLLKIEVTPGTDPIPTGAANAVLAQNMSLSIDGDKLERVIDRAYYGANPFVLINRRVGVEFDFDPLGAASVGTSAPSSAIMQACSHSETLVATTSSTFAPVSTTLKSATIYFYWGNDLCNINECRGSFSMEDTINQWPKAHAKFTGLFAMPAAGSLPSLTLTSWQDPPAVTMATGMLTINSVTLNGKSFTLDQGGVINIEEGTEFRDVLNTNRSPNGTVRFFYPGQAVFDLFAIASNHTKVPIVSTVDGGAGKKKVTTVAAAQFEMPKFVEIDGTVGIECNYTALPVSGNDEYAIVYS